MPLEQYIISIKMRTSIQNVTFQHLSNTSLAFCLAFIFPKVTFILVFQYYLNRHDSFIGIDDTGILWLPKLIFPTAIENYTNTNKHENQDLHHHGSVQMPVEIRLQSAMHCLTGVEQESPILSCYLSNRKGNKKGSLSCYFHCLARRPLQMDVKLALRYRYT